MTKKVKELLGTVENLDVCEKLEFSRNYVPPKVLKQLVKLAEIFICEGERDDFINSHAERAYRLAETAQSLGYEDYELTFVPGWYTLPKALNMLHEIRLMNGYQGRPAWVSESIWTAKARAMKRVDNLGFAEKGRLSVLLLNRDDENGKREGVFFTCMSAVQQIEAVDKLMQEKPSVRCLTPAEYVMASIIYTVSGRKLGARTSTRFVQYGLIKLSGGVYTPVIGPGMDGQLELSGDRFARRVIGCRLSIGES